MRMAALRHLSGRWSLGHLYKIAEEMVIFPGKFSIDTIDHERWNMLIGGEQIGDWGW